LKTSFWDNAINPYQYPLPTFAGAALLKVQRPLRAFATLWSLCICAVLPMLCHVLPASAQTQDSTILQLVDARHRALANNPGLAEMQERYAALTYIAPQAASLPDPVISLNAMNLPWDSFDTNQEPMTQLQLGVSQQFPFPGKLALREDIALFEAEAALHSVAEMRLNLDMNVTVTWWEIFYLDRSIDTVLKNQDVLRQLVSVARTKYEVGDGLQQDVLLAQLELSKLLDTEIQLNSLRQQRVYRLNVLMDVPQESHVELPSSVPTFTPEIASPSILYARAEQVRPLLRQEQAEIDASESRLELARKEYYPDFKVGVTYGNREEDKLNQSRQDFLSIMLSVNIPLYAGTRQSKAVQQHTRQVARARYSLLDQKNLVLASISTSLTQYRQAVEQLNLYASGIVPQARQTYKSMLAGYRVNAVDFLSLARSQATLFNSELLYWKALAEIHQSVARLTAAVGEENIYE
jgi:outer membrane protein, heavy metal efflux system